MKRIVPFLFLLLGVAAQASAEKADAYKQTKIDCRKCDQDTLTGIALMDGGVTITRGTMLIDAWRGRVETSPEGYQRATLEAGSGSKVRFRQKADGPGEQWMEGEAERVEYDDRTGLVKLLSKARVQRLQDGALVDEAVGEFISYDSRKEQFSLRNTSTGDDRAGAGRASIVIQPRRRPPTPVAAGTVTP
ncbi:lipopolysaccharide transport periplasmic protein LptA [Telluria aromaticivorans]|uniref:Lipopolysaccharide export system protein LptA n=1 Tax=Telluria aromaticivorans TaxID=2725995 RepID=A0A7Y2K0R9_9BURK|nr:lipopolysaccharide transport periplasmic protein LptA [Telluria aromaticivorans]NNG24557.1 lipopolysaccharide transport periplasmic protein LptA [Telluria aromaticivorans]